MILERVSIQSLVSCNWDRCILILMSIVFSKYGSEIVSISQRIDRTFKYRDTFRSVWSADPAQLDQKRALSRLGPTCRIWHIEVQPRLFRRLQLSIPDDKIGLSPLEHLVSFRVDGIKFLESVEVLPYYVSADDSSFRDLPDENCCTRASAVAVPSPAIDGFNVLLRLLMHHLPSNHSRSWSVE